jgi:hypothetical protein
MFLLNILLTMLAFYLAKKEYDNGRIEWAMFWSALLGWDLHTLIYIL